MILASTGNGPPDWALIVVVVVAALGMASSAYVGFVAIRRKRQRGEVSRPTPPPGWGQAGPAPLHVIGGGNVPTGYMRVNATWPLAVLESDGQHVALRIRGGRLFGAVTLYASAVDLAGVYPIRSLGSSGVAFRVHDGREWYFWTGEGPRILSLLAQAGFPVTLDEQKARKVWRAEP